MKIYIMFNVRVNKEIFEKTITFIGTHGYSGKAANEILKIDILIDNFDYIK